MVAATGGHLMQLTRLAARIEPLGRPLWATFDSPQSRSLLAGEDVAYVRASRPRDYANVARNVASARRLLQEHHVVEVISTGGSGIGISFLPFARATGVPCHYIESAARSEGPSLTGRVLNRVHGIRLYTQYQNWSTDRWKLGGSVFDEFQPSQSKPVDLDTLTVVVSLGTLDYRFDRLVNAVRAAALPNWNILWQVGPNDYGELPGQVESMLDTASFASHCAQADLVIAHAGVGSALTALEAGRHPVLVCRQERFGEHIDDHQQYIATELSGRGLATSLEPDQITTNSLILAAQRRVTSASAPAPFVLAR